MIARLRHEHLVRINDPTNHNGMWLTRTQLWEGLRHTVAAPQALDRSIDSALINELNPLRLKREIRRGPASLFDTVDLIHHESLVITAQSCAEFTGSSLKILIEEPAPGMLFVRFIYEVCGLPPCRDKQEDDARCVAYRNLDLDRIRAVRRYAARV